MPAGLQLAMSAHALSVREQAGTAIHILICIVQQQSPQPPPSTSVPSGPVRHIIKGSAMYKLSAETSRLCCLRPHMCVNGLVM